jgi:hypothetical protein
MQGINDGFDVGTAVVIAAVAAWAGRREIATWVKDRLGR